MEFLEIEPKKEDYWRSIILFGKNVASYKFALAKALLELKQAGKTFISLEELAIPYTKYLTEHLKIEAKQTTSNSSKFLDFCSQYNNQIIDYQQLIDQTLKLGFNNVIDAFHNVNYQELPIKFFIDDRKSQKGIILTDELLSLNDLNLELEIEARWRLVETAWKLKISRNLLQVNYDNNNQLIYLNDSRRIDLTSVRDAINGYQKGKCFYCFTDISIISGSDKLADVDHFFPRKLSYYNIVHPIDGVWNLVLSCQTCNRGEQGKFDKLPQLRFLERLHNRNEFYINSHHPLRETLMQQTGKSLKTRITFLRHNYEIASSTVLINSSWRPVYEDSPVF